MELLRYVMWRLDLTLHPTKTRLVSMWSGKEGFDFLGMRHQRHRKEGKGRTYYTTAQYPSKKARKKMRETIKHTIRRRERISWKTEDLIRELNPKIIGWRNYYGVQTARKWLNGIDWYIIETFTRWDSRKRQKKSHISNTVNIRKAVYSKGLQRLAAWRNAVERRMQESRMKENFTYGLTRGGWEVTCLLYHFSTLEMNAVSKEPVRKTQGKRN